MSDFVEFYSDFRIVDFTVSKMSSCDRECIWEVARSKEQDDLSFKRNTLLCKWDLGQFEAKRQATWWNNPEESSYVLYQDELQWKWSKVPTVGIYFESLANDTCL